MVSTPHGGYRVRTPMHGSRRFRFLPLLGTLAACQHAPLPHSAAPQASMVSAPSAAPQGAVPRADSERSPTGEPPPAPFSELVLRAEALSVQEPREPQKIALPSDLKDLRYDAYRSIRFRPEKSLWRSDDGEFEAQFFHPGFYYQEALTLFEVTKAGPREIPFSTDWFSYDRVPMPPAGAQLTFTGFRLHTALNQADYKDELVVFQGASYFRPLGRGTVYGLSARGLAVDLGEPIEEFPRFSEFYLVQPATRGRGVWVLALLESRSVTGAYAFHLLPGAPTVVSVTAELFPRPGTTQLGLAPLSSMYLFGEEGPNRFGDFRPEVHDSDGLSLWLEDGEWLYRPLRNPPRTTVCSFRADRLRGFGLLQRDRDFSSYQDLEAHHEARPSIWIEPISGFDAGSVRLLEIATTQETDDNIAVAFAPDARTTSSVRYRLHVGLESAAVPPSATVAATRIARSKNAARFLVDFANAAAEVPRGASETERDRGQVELVLTANGRGATVVEQHVEPHPKIAGHRASFELASASAESEVELRAFLRRGKNTISETWSYLWQPNP